MFHIVSCLFSLASLEYLSRRGAPFQRPKYRAKSLVIRQTPLMRAADASGKDHHAHRHALERAIPGPMKLFSYGHDDRVSAKNISIKPHTYA